MTITVDERIETLKARQTASNDFNKLYQIDLLCCRTMKHRLLSKRVSPVDFSLLLHGLYLSFLAYPNVSKRLTNPELTLTPEEVNNGAAQVERLLGKQPKGLKFEREFLLHRWIISYTVLCDIEVGGTDKVIRNTLFQIETVRPKMRAVLQSCPDYNPEDFGEAINNEE